MDLVKIQQEIKRTKYALVSEVTRQLEQSGWSVVNNRYYLSDQSDVLSEIDIVATKAKQVGWCEYGTDVHTVLLVSCKKPDNHAWGLLTRENRSERVDISWIGNSFWSNTGYFRYHMDTGVVNRQYLREMATKNLQGPASLADKQIFALQEIDANSGTQNNERRIAESIHELIRARRYETSVLAEKAGRDSVYQLNLLSVVDSKLLEINVQDKALDIRELREAAYVGKFVVDTGETSAGITFVQAQHFPDTLARLDATHETNCEYVLARDKEFYKDLVADPKRLRYLQRMVAKKTRERLQRHGYITSVSENRDMRIWGIRWDTKTSVLLIDIESADVRAETLNKDSDLAASVNDALFEVLRYRGRFRFELFIPY